MTDKNKAELIREAFADKKKGKLLELLRLASERAKQAPKFSKFVFVTPEPVSNTSARLPSELERSGYWAVKQEQPEYFNVQIELKLHYDHTLATLLASRPKAESGANLTRIDAKPLTVEQRKHAEAFHDACAASLAHATIDLGRKP